MKRAYANAGLILWCAWLIITVFPAITCWAAGRPQRPHPSVEDIPSPEGAKDSVFRGSVLPTFNKKLISNSLNILFDKLNACPDKGLVGEISVF